MSEAEENAIIVDNVYKNFNVYYDKTNTIKEKVLFWNKSKKEVREILKGINLKIKKGEAMEFPLVTRLDLLSTLCPLRFPIIHLKGCRDMLFSFTRFRMVQP